MNVYMRKDESFHCNFTSAIDNKLVLKMKSSVEGSVQMPRLCYFVLADQGFNQKISLFRRIIKVFS